MSLTGTYAGPSPVRRTSRAVVAGLAAAVLVLAAILAITTLRLGRDAGVSADRDSVLAAARQGVVNFTSLDYRNLDAQFRLIERAGTGAFLADLKAHEGDLRKSYVADQIVSQGRVLDAALTASSHDDATVVLFVDATLQAKTVKTPVHTRYRARVQMVRSGDRWLVEEVTPVA